MATGFGFASIAPMNAARSFGAAVTLHDGRVLVAGGGVTDGPFSAELYDDQKRRWTPSEMTTVRSGNTATLLGTGKVLVVGGDTSSDPSTAEVYTPSANSWEKVFNDLHSPRTFHTATLLLDGRVLVTGGLSSVVGPNLNTAEIFDPGSDPVNGSWTVVNPMNDGRARHTATLLPSGMVLIAGGDPEVSNSPGAIHALSSAELFDPTTGIWTPTSPMNDPHSGHTATLLSFGPLNVALDEFVVLIAGGIGSLGDISAVAELYKPSRPVIQPPPPDSTGSWVRAGSMNVTRMFHTATALPAAGGPVIRDRQVLVTGGPDPGNEISTGQTTEIYDLAADSWMLTGNMQSDRTGHTAALLSGGRVLLAGGLGGALETTTGPVQSAEVGTMCDANAQIIVSLTQTMDFGQVHAGWAFNNSNFVPIVHNTGNAELTLTATISGPDAVLFVLPGGGDVFPLAVAGTGPCISGPTGGDGIQAVPVQFNAWSPVPKTCSATLTLSDSNATNVSPDQTWVFPMTAQIILSPEDVTIEVTAPSFFSLILAGDTEVRDLVITLVSQVSEAVSAIVRLPPPPTQGAFHWTAGDYIVGTAVPTVLVPIEFSPLAAGSFAQTLQLISNAQGSPFVVGLNGTALEGFVS
jgi:Galactose oxidase, central domain/Kelch motif